MRVIAPLPQADGAFSRASTATYRSDAGLVATAAADEPRFQAGALLLEPAATNLQTYSAAFDNAAWSKVGASVTADVLTSPDGGTNADLLIEGTGTSGHYVSKAVACVAGQAYAASVYACAASGTRYPQIVFVPTVFGITLTASFDLVAGAVAVSSPLVTARIEDAGNGWWRCIAVATATATLLGGSSVRLSPAFTSFNPLYLGDGVSGVGLWGAQFEAGSDATSYIPTAGAAATRAADVFTRGMLSNVPETDYAAYAAGTTYAIGNRVILASTHRIYESLAASNTGHAPDTNPTWWLDVAPTNRWAMFDAEYSTVTALASGPLRVVLAPAAFANSIALLGLAGTSALVTVTNGGGSAVAYSSTVDLHNPYIVDWYGYFFEPFNAVQEVVLADLPPFINAIVTVTITGAPATACALLALGAAVELGGANLGVRLGINDYSRKETDAFGVATFVKRAFSRRLSVDLMAPNNLLNVLYRALSNLRATPCVWQVTDDETLQVLVLWGFYKDFSVTIPYPTHSQCALEIEGLI